MVNGFYSAAGNPTTTARELANELSRFAADLQETADELRSELSNMKDAQSAIQEELSFTANEFAQNTLTESEGDEFDTIAEIAQNVEELGAQGLSYARHSMIEERDSALAHINENLDVAVDAESVQQAIAEAEAAYSNASAKAEEAGQALSVAQAALSDWENSSVEDDLVRLNAAIEEAGGVTLTSDNRGYYETNIFTSTLRYLTSSSFRDVRKALDEYHSQDSYGRGRDAFADLPNFKEKYDALKADIDAAQNAVDEVEAVQSSAADTLEMFQDAGDIETDAQILEALQEKVANDLTNSPAFVTAMAKHYAEDFPRNLALLVAKQDTLKKLQEGTQAKLDEVQESFSSVSKQYRKMSEQRPNAKVKADLDQIKKRNQARSASYKRYRRAAHDGWTRTRDYDWDYRRNHTVYVDNGPDFLTTLLIYNMLTDSHDHHHHGDTFHAGENAKYGADLVGVDKASGEDLGLPAETFELSDAAASEFEAIGVDESFDLDAVDVEDPFELVDDGNDFGNDGDTNDAGDTFDIGGDTPANDDDPFIDNSPSFGGPSIGS